MSYRVTLEGGESFAAADGSLLSAALDAGVNLPSDCRQGACGTCRIKVLEGKVTYAEPPMALLPEDEADGYALACQARAASDLRIRAASAVLPQPQRYRARGASLERLAPDVWHLQLELPEPVDYLPGQYMKVHLPDGSTRNFSMASRPDGTRVDFHVRRIPGGTFTDGLIASTKSFDVELPFGSFIFRRMDLRPVLFVVTGTGLAPIRSMLDALRADPDCPPVTLYRGARTAADLYLHDELRAWPLRYVPVLSRTEGRYVQDAVCDEVPDLAAHAIYLCGSPAMIAGARQAFRAKGASMDYVYAEGFAFQHQEEVT
jgi:CDP-4-dehydro-6-deoxyglucose reductase